jgi:poly(A) polymerase
MDEMEDRISELMEKEELAALRPELDGVQVMELLDVPAGPAVGAALEFMMEIRLEEGILGEEVIIQRLREWWSANAESVMKTKRSGRKRSE